MRSFFWIGPVDLASRSHLPGDGAVGRVFESQQAEHLFDFNALMDVETAIDFAGLPVKSMVCVPFSSKNENLGVVQFVNGKDINGFSIKDARHYISYDNIALTAIGIIVGILLGIIMGSITVASIEPITSVFIKVLAGRGASGALHRMRAPIKGGTPFWLAIYLRIRPHWISHEECT